MIPESMSLENEPASLTTTPPGGSGIFAGDYAKVTLERCRLKYFDFGLSVAQSGSIQAVGYHPALWGYNPV